MADGGREILAERTFACSMELLGRPGTLRGAVLIDPQLGIIARAAWTYAYVDLAQFLMGPY